MSERSYDPQAVEFTPDCRFQWSFGAGKAFALSEVDLLLVCESACLQVGSRLNFEVLKELGVFGRRKGHHLHCRVRISAFLLRQAGVECVFAFFQRLLVVADARARRRCRALSLIGVAMVDTRSCTLMI